MVEYSVPGVEVSLREEKLMINEDRNLETCTDPA